MYFFIYSDEQFFPIFLNYRHYFPSRAKIKPLINIAIGTRLHFVTLCADYLDGGGWCKPICDLGFYSTIASGFKVKAFSFTSGIFVKSLDFYSSYYGGIEVKVGFTF